MTTDDSHMLNFVIEQLVLTLAYFDGVERSAFEFAQVPRYWFRFRSDTSCYDEFGTCEFLDVAC